MLGTGDRRRLESRGRFAEALRSGLGDFDARNRRVAVAGVYPFAQFGQARLDDGRRRARGQHGECCAEAAPPLGSTHRAADPCQVGPDDLGPVGEQTADCKAAAFAHFADLRLDQSASALEPAAGLARRTIF